MTQKGLRRQFAKDQKTVYLDQNETANFLFEEGVSDLGAAVELTHNAKGISAEAARGHRPAISPIPIGNPIGNPIPIIGPVPIF